MQLLKCIDSAEMICPQRISFHGDLASYKHVVPSSVRGLDPEAAQKQVSHPSPSQLKQQQELRHLSYASLGSTGSTYKRRSGRQGSERKGEDATGVSIPPATLVCQMFVDLEVVEMRGTLQEQCTVQQ